VRLTRWAYQCGGCRYAYDLPGIDLSFFHGSFLGISANLQAVVFDMFGYRGIEEIQAIVNSLVNELPDKELGLWPAKVLGEVSDPDPFGARYIFEETPGCPNCGSMWVATSEDTRQPWPETTRNVTQATWDALDHPSKVIRIRAALGLDSPAPSCNAVGAEIVSALVTGLRRS
jgi:hypothetical protein